MDPLMLEALGEFLTVLALLLGLPLLLLVINYFVVKKADQENEEKKKQQKD
ncbi:MAG TPA: hypothetical protein PLM44_00890 [bacterium]|jgi:hypothetical protein|nr:hypothetical protein [bacterium]HQG78888.1 hypothetical protein [bacterium]HQK41504.1 hypothetical protein [bacterium]